MTAYALLLFLHSVTRWLVLVTGVWALARALPGLSGRRAFAPADRAPLALFAGSLHLQLLLGLALFAVLGMSGAPAFGETQAGDVARASFQWEHMGLGLLAAVLATVGSVRARRLSGDAERFKAAAIFGGLAFVLVLLLIPWWRGLLPSL